MSYIFRNLEEHRHKSEEHCYKSEGNQDQPTYLIQSKTLETLVSVLSVRGRNNETFMINFSFYRSQFITLNLIQQCVEHLQNWKA